MSQLDTISLKDQVSFKVRLRRFFSFRKSSKRKKFHHHDRIRDFTSEINEPKTSSKEPENELKETIPDQNVTEEIKIHSPTERMGFAVEESNLYYSLGDGRKKLAIIFNHSEFRFPYVKISSRPGTNQDRKRIKLCLENKFGFKTTVFENPSAKKIKEAITEVSSKSSQEVSCIVVVVMTHGNASGMLCASDASYHKEELFEPFRSSNTKLVGVPKIFLFQACRGEGLDNGLVHDGTDGPSKKLPTHADFLVMYSTMEGFVSFREWYGSWFIQAICEQFEQRSENFDLLQMLTFASWTVANAESNTYDKDNPESLQSHRKKEMPVMESTLTKLLKFPLSEK